MNDPLILDRFSSRTARYLCSCGKEFVAGYYDVKNRKTRSCGCLKSRRTAERNRANAIDGLSHSPTGSSWRMAISRCYNSNIPVYQMYGAVGIRMCEYLRASVLNLIETIGERPNGTSIDRIDNEGHYSCGKCAECVQKGWSLNIRWATPTQQGRNQRTNHRITIGSETKCVAEWAEQIGVDQSCFRQRLKRGWIGNRLLLPLKRNRTSNANL